jgi:hypothetical protein
MWLRNVWGVVGAVKATEEAKELQAAVAGGGPAKPAKKERKKAAPPPRASGREPSKRGKGDGMRS